MATLKFLALILACLIPDIALAGTPCKYKSPGPVVACYGVTGIDLTGTQTYMLGGITYLDDKGTENIWLGQTSNTALTNGQRNVIAGRLAGRDLTSGSNNVLLGYGAGVTIAAGIANVAHGSEALRACGSCTGNVAVGTDSLYAQTVNDTTGIGRGAGYNSNAAGGTFIGRQAAVNATSGPYNVAIGYNAMASVTTGDSNTFIGTDSTGDTDTDGSIALGRSATVTSDQTFGVGSNGYPVTSFFLGEGETSASPSAVTFSTTKASGSNTAGVNLTIQGGRNTGTAEGGSVILQTAPAGGVSGATEGTPTTWYTLDSTGKSTFAGPVLLKNVSGSQPTLLLTEDPDNGTNTVTLQAPATLASDYSLTLPVDDGTNGQFLKTDGAGVTSWADASIVSSVRAGTGCCGTEIDPGDSGVTYNVTASGIALTAGTWDISGSATFRPYSSSTTITETLIGISTTSATMPSAAYQSNPDGTTGEIFIGNSMTYGGVSSDKYFTANIPTFRIVLAGSSTLYLVSNLTFTTGGVGIIYSGFLEARKVAN